MDDLEHLALHLKCKVVILGIGNRLRSDDGAGSLLAERLKDKLSAIVYDAGPSPENYLEKIIKDRPDNLVIIDAADFGGKAGDFALLEGKTLQTANFFSTHNASITLTINYLQNNFALDIIILAIQPKCLAFGDNLSPEVAVTLDKLENWFREREKKSG